MPCHVMRCNSHVMQPEPSTGSYTTCNTLHMHLGIPTPAIDVIYSMIIYKSRVLFGVGIYGLSPMGTQPTRHLLTSTNGFAYVDTLWTQYQQSVYPIHRVLHLIGNLALLVNVDPYFQCNPCDSVEYLCNFLKSTHYLLRMVFDQNYAHIHTHVTCPRMWCFPCICNVNVQLQIPMSCSTYHEHILNMSQFYKNSQVLNVNIS